MEKKKKITLPIKVFIVGCIIGLLVAGFGLFKQFDAKRINQERKEAALKQSQEAVDKANARLDEIEKEYPQVKEKYDKKKAECDSISMSDPNWFNKKTNCQEEESSLYQEMSALSIEQTAIKNADYTVYYDLVKPMSYIIFYIIGASIAGAALIGAFIIYLVKGEKSYL